IKTQEIKEGSPELYMSLNNFTLMKKSNSFSLKVFFSEVSSPRKSYLEVKK
ncbi:hypothetical protein BgiBS90_034042, partial [Biomphalaria glabrata]